MSIKSTQERPVVRKCYDCGGAMQGTRSNYKYAECGLDSVNLVNVLVFHCSNSRCGAVVPEIPAISELHREIAFALIRKDSLLTGEEMRFLRKAAGLSGKDLADMLGTHQTNLSKWESGAREISKRSDVALRLLSFTAILQELFSDDLLPKMAEVAKRYSEVDLKKLLQNIRDTATGPKRVSIDPARLAEFAKEDVLELVGMVQ